MPEIEPSELKRIPLFENLIWRNLTAVADLFTREKYPAGHVLCQQGEDPDNKAYYVRSGKLSVRHVDAEGMMHETTRLGPGNFFGQISLLLDQPQDDTIVVLEDATLLVLTRHKLDQLMNGRPSLVKALKPRMPEIEIDELGQIPLFAKLNRRERRLVVDRFESHEYQTERELFIQGQPGHQAFYVKSGELRVSRVDPQGILQEITHLGPGSFFGETSLLVGEPHDASVEVVQTAIVLSLDKDVFDALLKEQPSILRGLQVHPEVAKRRRTERLPGQYADEAILLLLRKHDIILQRHLTLPILGLGIGLLALAYGLISGSIWISLASAIVILAPFPFIWYRVKDHRNDYYAVTNKRVIQQERTPFGRENSGEAFLLEVQDIQSVKEGQLARLLNFGDLIIDTAGKSQLVIFRQIPDPEGVKNLIFEQRERARAWARAGERIAIRDAMQIRFGLQAPSVRVADPPRPPRRRKTGLSAWLSSFLPPLRYEEGTTITWRKHWVALIQPSLPPIGLAVGGTILTMLLAYIARHVNLGLTSILLGYGVFLVVPVIWWLWQFADWQNDTYTITATRIIDIEKHPFWGREERREADLERVQNIAVSIPGFMARLLKYGSVEIETAGEEPFTFDLVQNPNGVRAEISRRVDARRQQQAQAAAMRRRDELLEWFSVYDRIQESRQPKPAPPQEEEDSQTRAHT